MAVNIGVGVEKSSTATDINGTQTTRKIIDQAGVDKIMKDLLGSDAGLASLATGENVSGLSGTSVKTMLAQDLITKVVGEIANLTATTETVTNQSQTQSNKKGSAGLKTVICTELERQGRLDSELYFKGIPHFLSLSPTTVRGYRVWANKVVPLMQRSEKLSAWLAPIVTARYEHITGKRENFIGWLTVYVGQPLCYIIGLFVPKGEQYAHN